MYVNPYSSLYPEILTYDRQLPIKHKQEMCPGKTPFNLYEAQYQTPVFCVDGRVFGQVLADVFEFEDHHVKKAFAIPGLKIQSEADASFHVCSFQNKLLVASNTQVFLWDGDKLHEVQLHCNMKKVVFNAVQLYSFSKFCYVLCNGSLYELLPDYSLQRVHMTPVSDVVFVGGGLVLLKTKSLFEDDEELFAFNMVTKNQQLFIKPSIRFFEKHRIDRLCQVSECGCDLKDKALEYVLGFDWRSTKDTLENEFRLDRSQIGKQLVYEYSTSESHEEITPSKSSFFLVQ
ncbi:Hypothetical_protein [Hexamita inflata]|uniref:Hypothetical_protein n=1 Tax=Hexamita inflata TaxID=28002 RepID=A0ABP1GGQ0_9EUKA